MTYNPTDLRERFERQSGPVNTPEQYRQYVEFAGRQTGKTAALVDSIPTEGRVIIVCHSNSWCRELRKLVAERRPDVDLRRVTFISCSSVENLIAKIQDKTRGIQVNHVLLDNSVIDMFTLQFQRDVESAVVKRAPWYC